MQSEMTLTLLVLLINFQLFASNSMHQRIHSVTFLLILFGEWEEGW